MLFNQFNESNEQVANRIDWNCRLILELNIYIMIIVKLVWRKKNAKPEKSSHLLGANLKWLNAIFFRLKIAQNRSRNLNWTNERRNKTISTKLFSRFQFNPFPCQNELLFSSLVSTTMCIISGQPKGICFKTEENIINLLEC